MTNFESELSSTAYEQSECRSSHMVIWTNEIPTIFVLSKNESILEKNNVSVKAGKMI